MDIIETYGGLIKKYAGRQPQTALKMITAGLALEHFRLTKFGEKGTPRSLQYLSDICIQYLREALNHPEQSAWVNVFAPTEILHAMGIYPLFIEAFSSYLTGFKCEDFFIDCAERCGIAETLCSYHKAFIGAAEAGLLPKPKFAVATSMICDGNINTFRYLSDKYNIPRYIIDVPYEYSRDSEAYVVGQLKEMVGLLEETMGKKLDEDRLKAVIRMENQSREFLRRYKKSLRKKYFPKSLSLEMRLLFTSHVFMGRQETYNFYKMLSEEIETYDDSMALRVFWVHLIPFYQSALRQYFHANPRYQMLGHDFEFSFLEDLDDAHPYEAVAKKMLTCLYNGPYERKVKGILEMIDILKPDAVVNFCHWGCKQSSGGVTLLRDALKEKNIPFLILDGDAVDRRNGHDGQIKTRLEAFLEMVEKQDRSR